MAPPAPSAKRFAPSRTNNIHAIELADTARAHERRVASPCGLRLVQSGTVLADQQLDDLNMVTLAPREALARGRRVEGSRAVYGGRRVGGCALF